MALGPTIYRYWDTTGSPVGLYDFNGDLLDDSGNGNNLSNGGSMEYVTGFVPGTKAAWFYTSSRPTFAGFRFTGACTFAFVLQPRPDLPETNNGYLFSCDGTNGVEAGNTLYSIYQNTGSDKLRSLQEHGVSVDDDVVISPIMRFGASRPMVLHYVRDATGQNVTLYVDGYPMGSTTFPAAPTGGTSSTFTLGSQNRSTLISSNWVGRIGNLKVYDRELAVAEVEADAAFVSRVAKGNWP